jgi:hypothetical protein
MGIDQTLASISTPDRVGTSLGTLEFTERAAQRADLEKLHDLSTSSMG